MYLAIALIEYRLFWHANYILLCPRYIPQIAHSCFALESIRHIFFLTYIQSAPRLSTQCSASSRSLAFLRKDDKHYGYPIETARYYYSWGLGNYDSMAHQYGTRSYPIGL